MVWAWSAWSSAWLITSLNVISNMLACRVVWCIVLYHSWRYQSCFLYRWACLYLGKVSRICYCFNRCATVSFLWYNAVFPMGIPAAYKFLLQLIIPKVIWRKNYCKKRCPLMKCYFLYSQGDFHNDTKYQNLHVFC